MFSFLFFSCDATNNENIKRERKRDLHWFHEEDLKVFNESTCAFVTFLNFWMINERGLAAMAFAAALPFYSSNSRKFYGLFKRI
jgi:hypothetical protein